MAVTLKSMMLLKGIQSKAISGICFYSASQIAYPKAGLCRPGDYLNTGAKLRRGIWPWDQGIRSRLPDHFKVRYMEQFVLEPRPVHYEVDTRKYTVDEWGTRIPVQNIAIPIVYPTQANEGLWGGEGIIEGMRQKHNRKDKPRYSRIWKPSLVKRIFYSEILDKWMSVTVTDNTVRLIDEAYGFDFYILKTHEVDLKSKLGMKLKRMMIRALIKKSFHPDDPEKQTYVFEKYKEFIIPEDEVDWLGLDIHEAEIKQQEIEEKAKFSEKSLKYEYVADLVSQLKVSDATELKASSNWMSRLSPFKANKDGKDN